MLEIAEGLPTETEVDKDLKTEAGSKGKAEEKGKGRAQGAGSGDNEQAKTEWADRVKGILCDLVDAIIEKP